MMLDWLDGIAGPDFVRAILWTVVALIVLVIVLVVVKLIRSMTFGTFVAGGRNRKTRLAVMDATAVDSHRRLVLVRRDDIEHLLLIGGPTDVVVERDIRLVAPRRPVLTGGSGQQAAPGQKPQPPQASAPLASPPARQRESAGTTAAAPKPAPIAARPAPPAYPAPGSSYAQKPAQKSAPAPDALDDTFINELEVSLDDFSLRPTSAQAKASASPDDEMTKLLGELASHKR